MKVIYCAHPLGHGVRRKANLEAARAWFGFFIQYFEVAVIADWILVAGVWQETPRNRAAAMGINKNLVQRSDVVVLCGHKRSSGMRDEATWGRQHSAAAGPRPVVELPTMRLPPLLSDGRFVEIETMLGLAGIRRRIWTEVD